MNRSLSVYANKSCAGQQRQLFLHVSEYGSLAGVWCRPTDL